MNVLASNLTLQGNFVPKLLPSMCPSQKKHFHHSPTSLMNHIENNVQKPAQNSCNTSKSPNIFNQNTHEEDIPSSFNKISHFEVTQTDKPANSSEMISKQLEKTDFGSEILVLSSNSDHQLKKPAVAIETVAESPKSMCGLSIGKRARKNKMNPKLPEKHNKQRQVLREMMDVDFSNDSADTSLEDNTEGYEMDENHSHSLKLCDLLRLPNQSSPICVPMIDISMKAEIPVPTACLTFSISPPRIRQRQLSTTESEDSFIVFDSATDEECDFSEDGESESDESSSEDEEELDTDSPGSVVSTKMVRFADDKELCEIHRMIQWSFAYQAARKGPWEIYARDRARFKNRIGLIEGKIGHCFEPTHRQKVYDQRFKDQPDK